MQHTARLSMLALAAALAPLSACLDRELKPLNPCLVALVEEEVSVTNVDKVDLLFVVDNSQSMREEQASLQREFPKLIEVLTTGERPGKPPFAPAKDLHLGVVSSDLGLVGIAGVPGCEGLGDDAILNDVPSPAIADCQAGYPRFLSYLAGATDPARTATDFACIATLGTDGCGFEQPLEAALKALWPAADERVQFLGDAMGFGRFGHGDTDNAGFLRNDPQSGLSLVAIVVVSDEEDCSSADTRHFTPEQYLPADSPLRAQDLNLRCFHNPQNLYPVDRYLNGYRALRAGQEGLVVFGAIVGVPPDLVDGRSLARVDFEDESYRDAFYAGILADPRMQEVPDPSLPAGQGNLTPSCRTANGVAFPPRRLVEVARGFGERGVVQSICQDDFGPAMDAILEVIVGAIPLACLPRPLVRDAAGFVDCDVVWELPPPGTAPVGTPTRCADAPYLSEPEAGHRAMTALGGAICNVHQLAVANGAPRAAGGISEGWYYDDFSGDLGKSCPTTPQRVSFTPGARPGTGVLVKLECLDESPHLANTRTDLAPGVPQPAIGDDCAGPVLAGDTLPTGDAACAVTLRDGATDARMFCHREDNVCVLGCATDADCPPAWVCDARAETVASAGRATCVNPTCGE
jgi:hypothetical protein